MLVLCALAGAGCGGDDADDGGDRPAADAPGPPAVEEYDLVLPDDGVEGNPPPDVAGGD